MFSAKEHFPNSSTFVVFTFRLKNIYAEFEVDLEHISPDDDLRWYALNFGTGMFYNWPEFEVWGKNCYLSAGCTVCKISIHGLLRFTILSRSKEKISRTKKLSKI